MAANVSSFPNATADANATSGAFSVLDGCDHMMEGIHFDNVVQCFNLVVGIPANMLVIAILFHNRKEASTSDLYIGSLAFLDAYYGANVPLLYLNIYVLESRRVWSALKFAYGVKDTSSPLFLACVCLDRFVAVMFPMAFGRLKPIKYRLMLTVLVFCLTFTYAAVKMVGGFYNFEKVFTSEILIVFSWMVLCNVSILWALKRSRGAGKDGMHPMKKKAFKMVLTMMAMIVCHYMPPVVLFPFEDHYSTMVFRCYVQPVGFAFLNISSTIQPLVYLARLEKVPFLSDSCVKRFRNCFKRQRDEAQQTQSPPA